MSSEKRKTIVALKKAGTLLQKVQKMAENGQYCIDIIQQNLAVIGLLKSANLALLEGHLNGCVQNAVHENDEARVAEMMDEILNLMKTAQNK